MQKILVSEDHLILNYNKAYPTDRNVLLRSRTFKSFIKYFVVSMKDQNKKLYDYLTVNESLDVEQATTKITHFLRELSVFDLDETSDSYFRETPEMILETIQEVYKFWRSRTRFGIIESENVDGFGVNTLVHQDSELNNLLLRTYRLFEERAQGRRNRVYRQVQAGTNACFSYHTRHAELPQEYAALQNVPMIDTVMIRTPMILHLKSNKREGVINEIQQNPMDYFCENIEEWFCYPCKVGDLVCLVYFSAKYMHLAVSLANLFELATKEEAEQKPDLVLLFGNPDGKNETQFYHDKKNEILIGCVSDELRMDYFGYMKKMILTLHNVKKMHDGWLPIHGAFVKILMKNGTSKNIMLMGDSGAGKSESIEALKAAGKDEILDVQTIFDDMGTVHIEDGVPYGQGTEIGAFIRLDDLEPGTPYRDMDRSIFMSPEQHNSRMITPAAPYNFIVQNHKIDLFAYANNYTEEYGMKQLSVEEVKETCKLGKRMALGTTQEVGISTTYFANPFGPMQQQDVCEPLIDKVFHCFEDNGIFAGEIYTHLGFSREDREGLNRAASELLDFIMKGGDENE